MIDGQDIDPRILQCAEHSTTVYQVEIFIGDIRKSDGKIQLLIELDGLTDHEDKTWDPLERIHEDLPGLVEYFLQTSGDRRLKRQSIELLSTN